MWRKKKSAGSEPGPAPARGWRRVWLFVAGAGIGLALARLAGRLLYGELQPLRYLFVPLSALACGLAAVGAARYFAGLAEPGRGDLRRRHVRIALAVLALGVVLLCGLYQGFAVRIPYGDSHRSIAFIVGFSRVADCHCPLDEAACIRKIGLSVDSIRSCWNGVWVVELLLTLAYLLTLGSAGAILGLLAPEPSGVPGAPGYLDFDVLIEQWPDGTYRARGWSGAGGFEGTQSFTLPATLMGGKLGFGGNGARRGGPGGAADGGSPKQMGDELFRAVFRGELLRAFQGCLAKAQEGLGMRLRLRLNDVPHLAGLPWEYLYDAAGGGFLALSGRTPVVRYLELTEELGTLRVEPPLRVLAMISTPRGYRELAEADEEWRRLVAALEPLVRSGLVEVERLARPTREAFEARLRTGRPVHVLHFVGHGGFSKSRDEGVLIFENEDGAGVPVPGPSLAYMLQDHPSLRLAVLNACNGARGSDESAFAGTAQALIQRGVPAVIAMQEEVMDETACSFAEKFYRALAAGLPVDTCVGEVRCALAAERNPEWGTPVLYLRATDGRLFAFENH